MEWVGSLLRLRGILSQGRAAHTGLVLMEEWKRSRGQTPILAAPSA